MVRNVLILAIIVTTMTSTLSYGVYNIRDNNKIGGISLFLLAILFAVGLIYFIV